MKVIDNLKNIIQDRIIAFEKNPEIRRKYIATVYQADITDLVRPHLEKAEQKGIEIGKIEGFAEGEHKKAVETARKMKAYGDSVEKIKEITGLSKEEIKSL
jgi:predicted transposase/invertase (TIGR01784 family)